MAIQETEPFVQSSSAMVRFIDSQEGAFCPILKTKSQQAVDESGA
jgi:hypothetical protein